MVLSPISKERVVLYKGVGILLIVLHNFLHWVEPVTGQNEFHYKPEYIEKLTAALSQSPIEALHLFFSFFGHLGVALFIFLSAYGLTVAYGDRDVAWGPFVGKRLRRLYPVYLLAILTHALAFAVWQPDPWTRWLGSYIGKLSLLTNFVPGYEFTICGPWWFFSFIIQYYAVFHLLNALTRKNTLLACVALASLSLVLRAVVGPMVALNFRFTVLGWLPEICLGIYLARTGKLTIPVPAIVALVALFIAGNWFEPLWLLQSVSFTVLLLLALQAGLGEGNGRAMRALRFVGVVSLPLFATHGPLRLPLTELANQMNHWWSSLLLAAAFLVEALTVAWVAHQIAERIDRVFERKTPAA